MSTLRFINISKLFFATENGENLKMYLARVHVSALRVTHERIIMSFRASHVEFREEDAAVKQAQLAKNIANAH